MNGKGRLGGKGIKHRGPAARKKGDLARRKKRKTKRAGQSSLVTAGGKERMFSGRRERGVLYKPRKTFLKRLRKGVFALGMGSERKKKKREKKARPAKNGRTVRPRQPEEKSVMISGRKGKREGVCAEKWAENFAAGPPKARCHERGGKKEGDGGTRPVAGRADSGGTIGVRGERKEKEYRAGSRRIK